MAKAYATQTKQQVLDRMFDQIDDLHEKLDSEREYLEKLLYEREIVDDLAPRSETIEETDDWEIEKMVLSDMAAMSEMEIERIENDLDKSLKRLRAVHDDLYSESK